MTTNCDRASRLVADHGAYLDDDAVDAYAKALDEAEARGMAAAERTAATLAAALRECAEVVGARVAPEASLEFHARVPAEVRAVVEKLRATRCPGCRSRRADPCPGCR